MQPDGRTRQLLDAYFDIPADGWQALAEQLETVVLQGGDWLFHQGEPGDALYLLVRGRLQVWRECDGEGPLKTPRLIGGVAAGESVGEIALLSGAPRSAGVRASRDSELLRITRTRFERLVRDHPTLGLRLAGRAAALVSGAGSAEMGSARKLSAVTLLPLDPTAATQSFCDGLERELRRLLDSAEITRGRLEALGAPQGWPETRDSPPADLVPWLHRMEERHDLLVLRCTPGDRAWSELAMRQSDLVILVGEAGADPGLRGWERALGLNRSDALQRRMLVLLQGDSSSTIGGTRAWCHARPLEFHLHVRSDRADDVARAARVVTGQATGLVLGAGASRGFAHLGVYRALSEAGIAVDWVGGTSIGAIMGALIAFDWGPQHATNVARAAFVGGKPFSDYTLPLVSLLAGKRMRRLIGSHADCDIEDLPLPFFCISSRLDDGSANLHQAGSLAQALQASASMPGILPPTVVDDHLAVDGSILNSLPVDLMWRRPVGKVIAVTLTARHRRPVDYAQVPGAWSILLRRLMPFTRRYRVPALITVMLKSTELATLRHVEEQGARASLLLRPEVRRFGLTEVRAFDRIVEVGYRCAREALRDWPVPDSA